MLASGPLKYCSLVPVVPNPNVEAQSYLLLNSYYSVMHVCFNNAWSVSL